MNDFNNYRTVLVTALNVENFIYDLADIFKIWPTGQERFEQVLAEHLQLSVKELVQPDILTFAEYVRDYTDRQELIKIASSSDYIIFFHRLTTSSTGTLPNATVMYISFIIPYWHVQQRSVRNATAANLQ